MSISTEPPSKCPGSSAIQPARASLPSIQVPSIPGSAGEATSAAHRQWASDLQDSFEHAIHPNFLAKYTQYSSVRVLLLSWVAEMDDLKLDDEISALEAVFRKKYKFDCEIRKIQPSDASTAQMSINVHIINWLHERDLPGTLFIVYFAGHGGPNREGGGGLTIRPNKSPIDVSAWRGDVVWNETERHLSGLQNAHVLQIFDCCFAGAVKDRSGAHPRIEFLGASNKGTKPPGKHSFTTALVWALSEFAKLEGPFTTHSLVSKIRAFRDFPEGQEPVLLDRSGLSDHGKILLQPLTSKATKSMEPAIDSPKVDPKADIITLKLVFAAKPTNEDAAALAKGLGDIVAHKRMSVSRILWAGVGTRAEDALYKATSRWLAPALARRRSNAGDQTPPRFATIADATRLSKAIGTNEEHIGALQIQIQDSETRWRAYTANPVVHLAVLVFVGGVMAVYIAYRQPILTTIWLVRVLRQP